MIAFGASEEDLAAIRARAEAAEKPLEIWPDNWASVSAFVQMASQWRLIVGTGSAHWQGLRYEALEAVLRLNCIPDAEWPAVFQGVRVMEAAARDVLNARKG